MKHIVAALAFSIVVAVAMSAPIAAQQAHRPGQTGHTGHAHGGAHAQPYAGQQSRQVTSLDDDEVAALLDGRGMGLARPAELTGYPGPMHLLELASALQLSAEQSRRIEAVFAAMQARARDAGQAYVAAEKAVDEAFRHGADRETIAALVRAADLKRAETRLAHLEAHLEVTPLLTVEQRQRYSELRGYGKTSP